MQILSIGIDSRGLVTDCQSGGHPDSWVTATDRSYGGQS